MKKEALSAFGRPELILLAFLLFFFCFIGIVFWTYRKEGRSFYKKASLLPFSDKDSKGV